jgi:hypothetical protein
MGLSFFVINNPFIILPSFANPALHDRQQSPATPIIDDNFSNKYNLDEILLNQRVVEKAKKEFQNFFKEVVQLEKNNQVSDDSKSHKSVPPREKHPDTRLTGKKEQPRTLTSETKKTTSSATIKKRALNEPLGENRLTEKVGSKVLSEKELPEKEVYKKKSNKKGLVKRRSFKDRKEFEGGAIGIQKNKFSEADSKNTDLPSMKGKVSERDNFPGLDSQDKKGNHKAKNHFRREDLNQFFYSKKLDDFDENTKKKASLILENFSNGKSHINIKGATDIPNPLKYTSYLQDLEKANEVASIYLSEISKAKFSKNEIRMSSINTFSEDKKNNPDKNESLDENKKKPTKRLFLNISKERFDLILKVLIFGSMGIIFLVLRVKNSFRSNRVSHFRKKRGS